MKKKTFRIVPKKEYEAEEAAERKTARFLERKKAHEEKQKKKGKPCEQ